MKKICIVLYLMFSTYICFGQDTAHVKTTSDTTTAATNHSSPNDTIYDPTAIETLPFFPGGQDSLYKYLSKNLKYPKRAKDVGLQGKIVLTFVIEKNGYVSNIDVLKTIKIPEAKAKKRKKEYKKAAQEMKDEAIRCIANMPKWSPGIQNGKLVRVKYVIPIVFKL